MSGLSEEQIVYLRDVLGLESLVLGRQVSPRGESLPPPAVSEMRITGKLEAARLLVVAAGDSAFVFTGEAGALASKMIQAMKLGANDVATVEWTATAPEEVHEIWKNWKGHALSFGERAAAQLIGAENPSGATIAMGDRKITVTDSPARLLVEPERKKIAWAHLQSVMKLLS
ncbi:MAG: hypothetical protein AAB250_13660 [Bdellovibrionota bacterium]